MLPNRFQVIAKAYLLSTYFVVSTEPMSSGAGGYTGHSPYPTESEVFPPPDSTWNILAFILPFSLPVELCACHITNWRAWGAGNKSNVLVSSRITEQVGSRTRISRGTTTANKNEDNNSNHKIPLFRLYNGDINLHREASLRFMR